MSRRGTAHLLRENLQVPVFSFPQSSLSILTSVKKAADKLRGHTAGKLKVFLPNFRSEISGLEIIEEILDIVFRQGVYYDSATLRRIVFNASQEGFTAVIGGAATMNCAMQYGMQFQELLTPINDIIETVENAKSAALSNREEKATTHRYQSIINLASDGIFSTDSAGNLTTINQKARDLFNLPDDDILGRPVSQIITIPELQQSLAVNDSIQEQITEIEGDLFVYNQEPLAIDGRTVGTVATVKEIATVMRAENKVRRWLTRGFSAKYVLDDLLYRNVAMANIVSTCQELARTDSTVLVTGETGTGKEVVAQSIHNGSGRKHLPFVSIHCAALPEQLLESELFGYEEGAFTGSKRGGKPGLFEMAHQGTIFLDEVDSTSLGVQLRLLRVLQEKEVMRIGGDRKIPVDVRVIAAAGPDLWSAVQNGQFRKDLFFRLNVLRVSIPPLRERPEDIIILLGHFLRHHSKKHGLGSIDAPTVPKAYLDRLTSYSWPGNVRQLKHFAEQLVLNSTLKQSADTLDTLFRELSGIVDEEIPTRKDLQHGSSEHLRLIDPDNEAELVHQALLEARFSKTRAAKLLGISRTTLWRKLKQMNHGTDSA
jgi:PAS domain S-box-containing protein